MKKYINNELNYAYEKYELNNDDKINKTIEDLNKLKEDVFKLKNYSYDSDTLSNLINIKLNDYIYSFILYLIELYIFIPLLETETSIKYPIIRKQIISDKYIYDFSYRILESEKFLINFSFNKNNLKIFENNHSLLKKSDSRCVIYKKYYANKAIMLLNRYNNITDLVAPLKKFIEVVDFNDNILFSNNSQIFEYYMQHKTIQKLINNGNIDAYKLLISTIDSMVYNARLLKKSTENKDWKHLTGNIVFKLLDFANHAIAIELVNNNISINELFNILRNSPNDEYINISKLPIKKDNIENNINNYVNKLTKKQYL